MGWERRRHGGVKEAKEVGWASEDSSLGVAMVAVMVVSEVGVVVGVVRVVV